MAVNGIGKIKMKVLLTVILLAAWPFTVSAQHLDRQQLDAHIKKADTAGLQQHDNLMYVINGIPFSLADSLRLDAALLSYPVTQLIDIDFLLCRNTRFIHCSNNPVLILRFAYQQSLKEKRLAWKKVKPAFRDKYVSFSQHIFTHAKDPVLYINNIKIHHTEAKQQLKALSPRNIYYIECNDQPQPATMYGQLAKNGLVRIWTIKN